MVRSCCFAPGCTIGYISDRKRRKAAGLANCSLFKCPKQPGLLTEWQKRIPRADKVFSEGDALCELHFTKDCILRFYETKLRDGTVHKLERGMPTLKKGSVPTIFPHKNTTYALKKRFIDCSNVNSSEPVEKAQCKVLKVTDSGAKHGKLKLVAEKENKPSSDKEVEKGQSKVLERTGAKCDESEKKANFLSFLEQFQIEHVEKERNPSTDICSASENKGKPIKKALSAVLEETIEEDLQPIKIRNEPFSFDVFLRHLKDVEMPSKWWTVNALPEYVAFTKWDFRYNVVKKFIINSDLTVKLFLQNQEKFLGTVSNISSPTDVTEHLKTVDASGMCSGLSDINLCKECLGALPMGEYSRHNKWCTKCVKKRETQKPVSTSRKYLCRAIAAEKRHLRLKAKADLMKETIYWLKKRCAQLEKAQKKQMRNESAIRKRVIRKSVFLRDMPYKSV